MKRLSVAFVALLMWSVVNAQSAAPDLTAAYKWLAVIDEGRYYQSWQYAGELFKSRIEASQWDQVLKGTRSKLGALQNRTLSGYGKRQQFSNLPEGDYLVLKFSSQFETAALSEILVLTNERGELRVVAYFIQ